MLLLVTEECYRLTSLQKCNTTRITTNPVHRKAKHAPPLWEARVYAGQYSTELHHCRTTSPHNHATTKLHYCKSPLPHQYTYKLLLVEEGTGKTKRHHKPQTHRAIKPQTYIPTYLQNYTYQAIRLSSYLTYKSTTLQGHETTNKPTNLQSCIIACLPNKHLSWRCRNTMMKMMDKAASIEHR